MILHRNIVLSKILDIFSTLCETSHSLNNVIIFLHAAKKKWKGLPHNIWKTDNMILLESSQTLMILLQVFYLLLSTFSYRFCMAFGSHYNVFLLWPLLSPLFTLSYILCELFFFIQKQGTEPKPLHAPWIFLSRGKPYWSQTLTFPKRKMLVRDLFVIIYKNILNIK